MKKKQLSILYTRKIIINKGSIGAYYHEKEFLIRRTSDQYAIKNDDGVRYVLFKDARDNDKYIVVGRMLGGNKYKNYYLSSMSDRQLREHLDLALDCDIKSEHMLFALEELLSFSINNKANFKRFVKVNFNIDYDNTKS
jgi:hypothetical protein